MDRRAMVDERIRSLLTSTDMTFKQIIEQLRSENISISFNTIRRVNRDHIYRKPRYDAKLTPQQRKQLIVMLKNTLKPNLSLLARQFGVCHGSIWYWWDKLSKIREKNNGQFENNAPVALDEIDDLMEQEFAFSGSNLNLNLNDALANAYNAANANLCDLDEQDDDDDAILADPESDPLDLSEADYNRSSSSNNNNSNNDTNNSNNNKSGPKDKRKNYLPTNVGQLELVGSVQAKSLRGDFIKLPITMFAPVNSSVYNLISAGSPASSSLSSSASSSASPSFSSSPTSSIPSTSSGNFSADSQKGAS